MTIPTGVKWRDYLLSAAMRLADDPTQTLAFLAAADDVIDSVRDTTQPQERPMAHPKYDAFKQAFTLEYGIGKHHTGKHPHGKPGTIEPEDLRVFLHALAANALTVPAADLPELIADTAADIDHIVTALTN